MSARVCHQREAVDEDVEEDNTELKELARERAGEPEPSEVMELERERETTGRSSSADALDALVTRPFARKVVWRLMQLTGVNPAELHSYAIKLSAQGAPLTSLEDDSGHIYMMTSVIEYDGKLYLGSLINDAIGVLDAP